MERKEEKSSEETIDLIHPLIIKPMTFLIDLDVLMDGLTRSENWDFL